MVMKFFLDVHEHRLEPNASTGAQALLIERA
jgi:hypothetical protein